MVSDRPGSLVPPRTLYRDLILQSLVGGHDTPSEHLFSVLPQEKVLIHSRGTSSGFLTAGVTVQDTTEV